MLWYKTWRETRTRLLISAAAMAWVCFAIVLTQHGNRAHQDPPIGYVAYIWKAVYRGYARDFFIVLVILMGGGGLLQERAHGTAGFTLSLPVSRSRLMAVRVAVGLIEVIILALVPAVAICALSPMVDEYYALCQALQFTVLWAAAGAVIFAAAVLLSTVLGGEYSGWIVCFLCVMLYSAAVNITALQALPWLNIFKIMSGSEMPYFNSGGYFLTGPLPWQSLFIMLAIASSCFAVADRFTHKRDY
jgi:ABC-type transport system involved in multi-copper enzyme maturation permease subunit